MDREVFKKLIKKLKKIIITILSVVALIMISVIPIYFPCYTGISNVIYFLTFIAIVCYTFETKLLREATLGRPLISIMKNVSNTIEVRNDGSNIAYNIKIYFYYNTKKTKDKIEIAVLGKGLPYKIGITNKKITKDNGEKVELSELINASPPDKNLKVLIVYSDSLKDKNKFKGKWKLDETVIMSSADEGRFRMVYDEKII